MTDRYSYARGRVAARLAEFNTGVVTLTRVTHAPSEEDTPWIPGAVTLTTTYELDARVDGVTEDYVDGATIEATDLKVIVSAAVPIVPGITDLLTIDGSVKAIKRVEAVPAAGDAALYHIFVAS